MKLFIGCSSQNQISEEYLNNSKELLNIILKDNDLVFGASGDGIMGIAHKIAKENNRYVIGICPKMYESSFKKAPCDEEIVTETMLESTVKILAVCDVIIILPGGIGTVYEIFTSLQSKLCGEHDKPIIIYNFKGYYDPLLKFIDEMCSSSFTIKEAKNKYFVANTIDDVVRYLDSINKVSN